ncbi:hypothetical protein BDQ17DRAFT_1418246 [Cyathus striatus]|nr:hypothetical protein BDQ17DRAFT_1418246 [Cyathus striatus]
MTTQTFTPLELLRAPEKNALIKEFIGKSLESLRTPAMIIDRKLFADNCARMHARSKEWGATFRAHLKTHKVRSEMIMPELTSCVVVSTVLEAWELVRHGLVADGAVTDILYGLPIALNKIADLSKLQDEVAKNGAALRILVDHPQQVQYIDSYEKLKKNPRRWSMFVKINGGQNRAGVVPSSEDFLALIQTILKSPAASLYGFYGHAGNSYSSTSRSEATDFLSSEVKSVNEAAKIALDQLRSSPFPEVHTQPFILSVGSTPTAHAANAATRTMLASILHGTLELHAGNYPLLDLQQLHTSLIDRSQISQHVRATVVSYYHGRGKGGADEAMVDAGAIAFSKDSGPSGHYGEVVGKAWILSRISQEHGILTRVDNGNGQQADELHVGSQVDIVGQHACLIAAAYPWFYIVDSSIQNGTEVVDIWVPWKGW